MLLLLEYGCFSREWKQLMWLLKLLMGFQMLHRQQLIDVTAMRRYLLEKTQHIVGGFGKGVGATPGKSIRDFLKQRYNPLYRWIRIDCFLCRHYARIFRASCPKYIW